MQRDRCECIDKIDYWKELYFRNRQVWQKFKWLNYGSQRKRFLAEIKTSYALEVIHKLQRDKKRFICFAGSIKQAEILGSKDSTIHSKCKNTQNIIDNFNNLDYTEYKSQHNNCMFAKEIKVGNFRACIQEYLSMFFS